MVTRLNITADKEVVEQAKRYARSQGRSLSGLIEGYLKSLISDQKEDSAIDPVVKSLWGSVKPSTEHKDYKELLQQEIIKKHLK
jgi:hypothetical protein